MIPADRSHLHVAAVTHPGMKGKNNEDRYGVSAYRAGEKNSVPTVLAIVSDGIGGHRAGEVAAEMAVEIINRVIAESTASDPPTDLQEAIVLASQAIREQADTDLAQKGMGATCACAWVIGSRLYTASVGDSRIYLIRGETIKKITIDHTWIQEALEFGALTPDQARGHPNAHVIRRYLGSFQPVVPDIRMRLRPEESDEQSEANQGLRLIPGDQVLLCSDGLTDLVEDSEILAALKTQKLKKALDSLVALANERGGHDNITIVALEAPQRSAAQPLPEPEPEGVRKRALPITLSCIGAGILLVAGILITSGMVWLFTRTDPTATPSVTPTATGLPVPTLDLTPLPPLLTPREEPRLTAPALPLPSGPELSPTPTFTPWPTATPLQLESLFTTPTPEP